MKMRNSNGKKAAKDVSRRASRAESLNLPRIFLFLELFVDKDVQGQSTK
jgi:hypothetical protein